MRGVKQIQDQLNVIEEILLERSPTTNQIRGKNRHQHNGKSNHGPSSAEVKFNVQKTFSFARKAPKH